MMGQGNRTLAGGLMHGSLAYELELRSSFTPSFWHILYRFAPYCPPEDLVHMSNPGNWSQVHHPGRDTLLAMIFFKAKAPRAKKKKKKEHTRSSSCKQSIQLFFCVSTSKGLGSLSIADQNEEFLSTALLVRPSHNTTGVGLRGGRCLSTPSAPQIGVCVPANNKHNSRPPALAWPLEEGVRGFLSMSLQRPKI